MSTTALRIGCNVIDPLLEVTGGGDYDLSITRRSLEFLVDSGFDALEFSHCLHWSDDEVGAVCEMAGEIGIDVWSIHAWAGGDVLQAEEADATRATLSRAGEVALGLGAGRIVHHTSGNSLDGDGRERLAREAEVIWSAWRPGFQFAIENTWPEAQMEYLVALVDALGSEVAGVCIDTGHAHLVSEFGAGKALRMAGERLITTHLQDNHGDWDEHLPPGYGTIDWDDVAAALGECGYAGCLLLELTDQPPDDRRERGVGQEIRDGAEMARQLAVTLSGIG